MIFTFSFAVTLTFDL